jgi:hypothetical protein
MTAHRFIPRDRAQLLGLVLVLAARRGDACSRLRLVGVDGAQTLDTLSAGWQS